MRSEHLPETGLVSDGPVPVRVMIMERDEPTGELLLWVQDGCLGTLEGHTRG